MIQRLLILLITFGYLPPIATNPLYLAYQNYDRQAVEQLLDQGPNSRVQHLEQAVKYALEKDKDPHKNFDNAAIAVRMQADLIEMGKSWFQRHYRLTSIGIPFITCIAAGLTVGYINNKFHPRQGQS